MSHLHPSWRAPAAALIALLMSACAGTAVQKRAYVPPTASPVTTQPVVVIDKPFEVAWNDLVRRMTASQFKIRQVSKDSRVISLDFEMPQSVGSDHYVDCGRISNTITWDGKTRTFDYSLADSNYYEVLYVDNVGDHMWAEVKPSTRISGTVNVYMTPQGPQRTEMSVNTRYQIRRDFGEFQRFYYHPGFGRYAQFRPGTQPPMEGVFTTQTSVSFPIGDFSVRCVTTGFIENTFLGFARD